MLKGMKAGELVKKASETKGAELAKNGAKRAADHKAVQAAFQTGIDTGVDKAVRTVAAFASGGAVAAIERKRDKRKERRYAVDLARQVGGTFSLNVIIGSERHHVVWLADGAPYRVVPELPKDAGPLEGLPDLKLFSGARRKPKPQKA